MDIDFCLSFCAFVQIMIAYDFGLTYFEHKQSTIFTDIQNRIFDAFRHNYFTKKIFNYTGSNKVIRTPFMKKWYGYIVVNETKIKAALDIERTNNYLAVLGIISGIYGLSWLVLIPWSAHHLPRFTDFYMTLTICTIVTESIMFLKALYTNVMSQTKVLIQSTIVLILSCLIGYFLYTHDIVVENPLGFERFFMVSMFVVGAPIGVYVIHIIISLLTRFIRLGLLIFLASAYKLVALLY